MELILCVTWLFWPPLYFYSSLGTFPPLSLTKIEFLLIKSLNRFQILPYHFFRYVRKRNRKFTSRIYCRGRFFRTIKQWNLKQYHFRDYVLADCSHCYGNFIHHNGIADNQDCLSGGKNLPEILLGYHQYYGGTNEYSYCNLLWWVDKICYSDKPYCTITSCACDLYRNPMLCERLAWRTRILLRKTQGDVFIFLC